MLRQFLCLLYGSNYFRVNKGRGREKGTASRNASRQRVGAGCNHDSNSVGDIRCEWVWLFFIIAKHYSTIQAMPPYILPPSEFIDILSNFSMSWPSNQKSRTGAYNDAEPKSDLLIFSIRTRVIQIAGWEMYSYLELQIFDKTLQES